MKLIIAIALPISSCMLFSSCGSKPDPGPVVIHRHTIIKPKPVYKPKPKPRPATAESFRAVESAN